MGPGLQLKQIGVIRSPYVDRAPYQPVDEAEGGFFVLLDGEYAEGLRGLSSFRYMYLIYYIDRLRRSPTMIVNPSWTPETTVGLFASRSPARPNPIGISIVRIKEIEGNRIVTSGLDVFDGTPLLDIKPYVKDLDSKDDANRGWLDTLDNDEEHLLLHIRGIPHDY